MSRFKILVQEHFLHLYAWFLGVPSVFLVTVFTFYIGRPGSVGDAVREIVEIPYFMFFLVPWSVLCGYVEAWVIQKWTRKYWNRKGDNLRVQ